MNFQAPKGTRDFLPDGMSIRRQIIDGLILVYKLFGFKEWDGPAFEYLETLTRKSGEEVTQEIYTFQDKAGRKLGLRFELTASLARIIAANPNLRKPLRVYNIGKVWRYERPQAGRFREFLQADADIFGASSMVSECELLSMAVFALRRLEVGEYVVLLNNRKILEAQLRAVGIKPEQQVEALRALDKLSKIGEEGVRSEFKKRNLSSKQFDGIMELVKIKGSNVQKLEEMRRSLNDYEEGIRGIEELEEIIRLLDKSYFQGNIEVDFSLVRGLDYYTGPIFEIRSESKKDIGSFAGGGRYDQLVELFGGKPTPAVGISFGIERLIEIVREKVKAEKMPSPVKVFVAYELAELLPLVLRIIQQFRAAGVSAECDIMGRSLSKQLDYANNCGIPYCFIVFSQDEQKLKEMATGQETILTPEQAINRLSSI